MRTSDAHVKIARLAAVCHLAHVAHSNLHTLTSPTEQHDQWGSSLECTRHNDAAHDEHVRTACCTRATRSSRELCSTTQHSEMARGTLPWPVPLLRPMRSAAAGFASGSAFGAAGGRAAAAAAFAARLPALGMPSSCVRSRPWSRPKRVGRASAAWRVPSFAGCRHPSFTPGADLCQMALPSDELSKPAVVKRARRRSPRFFL